MKHSYCDPYLKKTSLKLSKNVPQTKYGSQMVSLKKLLKTLQIAVVKNLKMFSINAYMKINKCSGHEQEKSGNHLNR